MKRGETQPGLKAEEPTKAGKGGKAKKVFDSNIADSLDLLVEYLVENGVRGIHPLIMGEVEKRLIIKVLERSRGNKLQAAKLLGMSRNTFHRKIQKLVDCCLITDGKPDV
jgi:DNA-binding protein Fis